MEGKLKVLCLHGFTQNAETFRAKTGSVRKSLKSKVDFVFVDAPHSAAGFFDDDDRGALGTTEGNGEDAVGPRSWWLMGENDEARDSERANDTVTHALARYDLGESKDGIDDPTGTTDATPAVGSEQHRVLTKKTRPAQSTRVLGWSATEALLLETIKTYGPFDGVLGFSQGASTAVLALATIPELKATCEFAVLFSGFEPLDASAAAKLRRTGTSASTRDGRTPPENAPAILGVRSLHVHGVNDRMVSRQRAEALLGAFAEVPELFSHQGGHGVPTTKEFRERLKRFVLEGAVG
jgi:hypothetical protein